MQHKLQDLALLREKDKQIQQFWCGVLFFFRNTCPCKLCITKLATRTTTNIKWKDDPIREAERIFAWEGPKRWSEDGPKEERKD